MLNGSKPNNIRQYLQTPHYLKIHNVQRNCLLLQDVSHNFNNKTKNIVSRRNALEII